MGQVSEPLGQRTHDPKGSAPLLRRRLRPAGCSSPEPADGRSARDPRCGDPAHQAEHDQVARAPGAALPAEAVGRLHERKPRCSSIAGPFDFRRAAMIVGLVSRRNSLGEEPRHSTSCRMLAEKEGCRPQGSVAGVIGIGRASHARHGGNVRTRQTALRLASVVSMVGATTGMPVASPLPAGSPDRP
jgi:hypothetical protein